MENAAYTSGLVAVIIVLTEMIKYMIGRTTRRETALSDEEHEALMDMARQHRQLDSDGVPLCFTPRRTIALQEDIQKACVDALGVTQQMCNTQNDIKNILMQLQMKFPDVR